MGCARACTACSRKWEMVFVDSGERAIKELEGGHYDVIVTDMRMPGMDGAQLLQTVSAALAGSGAHRALGLRRAAADHPARAHRPPVSEQAVRIAAPRERDRARGAAARDAARSRSCGPASGESRSCRRCRARTRSCRRPWPPTTVTVQDIAKIVAADTAIAARVLQIVNSAFFRLARRITNVEQAVTYLGFAAVRNLVMSAEVFAAWQARDASVNLESLQTHVLRVATATQALTAKRRSRTMRCWPLWCTTSATGSWRRNARTTCARRSIARKEGIELHEAEKRVIGSSHAEIGAYLLGLWGLPYSVIEAVAHHHAPQRVTQTDFDVLAALAVAHSLTEPAETHAFDGELVADQKIGADYLESLNAPFDWAEAERRVRESLDAGADES